MKRLIILITIMFCALSLVAQTTVTVSGVVKNRYNNRALEYVNVYVPGTHIGTITNSDGEFSIKIPNQYLPAKIEFSHLGFQSQQLDVTNQNLSNQEIKLAPGVIRLNEIVVEPVHPRNVIERAMQSVRKNYPTHPTLYKTFYREFSQIRKKYINIAEAVADVYKTSYAQDIIHDRVRIAKGRRLVSPKPSDTLDVKLEGGPGLALSMDVVKSPGLLLDPEYQPFYDYEFKEFVIINNKLHYAITFRPRVSIENTPLYLGTIYVEKESYAISRIEFNMDMSDRDKVTNTILRKKPLGMRFRPTNISYLVTYRQDGDKYYLNYIRTELKFNCDWKRKLFATNFTIVSEMVMTDREDNPEEGIPYRESFGSTKVLSDKVQNFYDENFWEDYNIIEPTESLEFAVQKLKKAIEK